MQEINLGDPWPNNALLKGHYEKIIRWFEDEEDAKGYLEKIERGEDGHFGGNRFFKAQDVLDEVKAWKEHIPVLSFGLAGMREKEKGDLCFETLILKVPEEVAKKVQSLQKEPLLELIQDPDSVEVEGDKICIWYD